MSPGPSRATRLVVVASLVLGATAALPVSGAAASAGPSLTIDVGQPAGAISPDVYGASFPTPEFATAANIGLARWGGNSTTRYDYRTNFYSTANDWYFENHLWNDSATPSALDTMVTTANTAGERAAVTVPVIGWVAKDDTSCGFARAHYSSQQSWDPWNSACGNGRTPAGADLAVTRPATDTSKAFSAADITTMATHLAAMDRLASPPLFYQLDNEPSLWSSTHRDVQPSPVTGTALLAQSVAAADAIRAGDPRAVITGPGDWGWCAYFFFPQDNCSDGADRTSHGGLDLGAAYLKAFHDHDVSVGHRTLSVVDEHFYPQGDGVALATGAGSAATQALRLRSTRALWDPTYADESWIATTGDTAHENVMLIPRMKAWVQDYYPGTGLAIGEYNFGALDSMNGALAQADVLGILGREGVQWAALWGPPETATAPGTFAFRMFRNLDGHGAGFGTTSVHAASTDQGALSVYAATRADGTVTAVVVNKTTGALTSPVSVAGATLAPTGTLYRYSATDATAIVTSTLDTSTLGAVTFPASSITTLVLPKAAPGPQLTLGRSTSTVTYPGTATLTVRLTDAGLAVPDALVGVWQRVRGTTPWYAVATRTTSPAGAATVVVRPAQHMEYVARDLRTLPPGDPLAADTAPLTVLSRRAATLGVSPAHPGLGATVRFYGRVTPHAAGLAVSLQRLVQGVWHTAARGHLLTTSTFSLSARATARGTSAYRVVVAGDATHLSAVSASRSVVVR